MGYYIDAYALLSAYFELVDGCILSGNLLGGAASNYKLSIVNTYKSTTDITILDNSVAVLKSKLPLGVAPQNLSAQAQAIVNTMYSSARYQTKSLLADIKNFEGAGIATTVEQTIAQTESNNIATSTQQRNAAVDTGDLSQLGLTTQPSALDIRLLTVQNYAAIAKATGSSSLSPAYTKTAQNAASSGMLIVPSSTGTQVPTDATSTQVTIKQDEQDKSDSSSGVVSSDTALTAEEEEALNAKAEAGSVPFPNVDYDKTGVGVPPTAENYAAWNAATNPNNATPNVADWDRFQADLQTLRDAHEKGIIDDYDFNSRVDKVTSAYTSGNYAANVGDALAGIAEKAADAVVDPNALDPNKPGTGIGTNVVDSKSIVINDYVGCYGGRGARLTQFVYSDGTDDDDRLAYLQLMVPNDLMASVATGANKQAMDAIYAMIKDKYNRFIVNSLQESRAEKSNVIKTVGDSFAVTFSGREPMVINVSGSLIFDYDRSRMSWYTAFMNAYEYYLRASQSAKYKAKVKLVFPDFTEYTGYMLSVSSSQSSDNDMVIPFNFSMLVVQESFNKAYSYVDGSTRSIAQADNSALAAKDSAASAAGNVNGTATGTAGTNPTATQAATGVSPTAADVGAAKQVQATTNSNTAGSAKVGSGTGLTSQQISKLVSGTKIAKDPKYKSVMKALGISTNAIGVRLPKI